MSDLWTRASAAAAARISSLSKPPEALTFTPWSSNWKAGRAGDAGDSGPIGASVIDPANIENSAYAQGYDEGRRVSEEELAEERAALNALAESLHALQPEPPLELAALLAETVERLVRQIVGEVSLDGNLLLERVNRAAALVAEEATPTRMRLHPDDLERIKDAELPVALIADPSLGQGMVLLETGEGWIEDGPEVGLEKLRIALDKMGVPR